MEKKKNIPPGSNCMQNMACVNMLLYNVLMWFAPAINQWKLNCLRNKLYVFGFEV